MPCISIILTTYNHEKYIDKAIDSILNQTFTDYEILIGDDSHDDKTWNIIKRYCKSNPDKIQARHHEENKWIIRNMEFLIKNTKWNYIAVLEWDDYRDNEYLSKKMEIFSKKHVALVYNDLNFIDWKWKIIQKGVLKNLRKIKNLYKEEKFNLSTVLLSHTFPYHSRSTIMFKKEVLKKIDLKIPWLSPYSIISDYNFFLMVWSNYPIYGTENELTFYRIHENNTSKNSNLDLISELYQLAKFYKNKSLISEETFKNIATRRLLLLIIWYIRIMTNISKYYTLKNFFSLLFQKFK